MTEYLEPEDVQDTIDYAVYAAAAIFIMKHSTEMSPNLTNEERLAGFSEIISVMYEAIPHAMRQAVVIQARNLIYTAHETEAQVQEFLKQIEEL